jgi:hypothetical protein
MPYLVDEVRRLIESVDETFDGNDFVIFEGFVLPVLEENLEKGFDSDAMLDKGFVFLIGLIPDLLNRRRAEMDPSHFGMLARLYHRHTIERILGWIDGLDDSWYEENLPGLYRDLGWVRAIRTRTSP